MCCAAVDVNEITGIIYQVSCHDCPFVYIGQTKPRLEIATFRTQKSDQVSTTRKACSLSALHHLGPYNRLERSNNLVHRKRLH